MEAVVANGSEGGPVIFIRIGFVCLLSHIIRVRQVLPPKEREAEGMVKEAKGDMKGGLNGADETPKTSRRGVKRAPGHERT